MVGGDDIAATTQARLPGIKLGFGIDQLIQARDVLLRRHSPQACLGGAGFELDPLRQWTEKQIVIEEVSFLRIEVFAKTTRIIHDAFQLLNNPIRKLKTLNNFRLQFLFWRRHFMKHDLSPN